MTVSKLCLYLIINKGPIVLLLTCTVLSVLYLFFTDLKGNRNEVLYELILVHCAPWGGLVGRSAIKAKL